MNARRTPFYRALPPAIQFRPRPRAHVRAVSTQEIDVFREKTLERSQSCRAASERSHSVRAKIKSERFATVLFLSVFFSLFFFGSGNRTSRVKNPVCFRVFPKKVKTKKRKKEALILSCPVLSKPRNQIFRANREDGVSRRSPCVCVSTCLSVCLLAPLTYQTGRCNFADKCRFRHITRGQLAQVSCVAPPPQLFSHTSH